MTGDEGAECKVLRASCDLRSIEVVLQGTSSARRGCDTNGNRLYLSTDTPSEKNHVYRLDRQATSSRSATCSSSIYGCRVGKQCFSPR